MSVYDDVAVLQQEMTAAQAAITALQQQAATMQPQALTEGADLFNLSVGKYYIPSNAICSTLLNKPVTNNWTGFIDVIEGGADGQKIIIYRPCSKDFATYYQNAYYSGAWGDWKEINLYYSDWNDLALNTGITAYNDEQKPRYKKIGKTVFISGVVKGLTEIDTAIATLPSGFRPSKRVILPIASVGQMISKMSIDTNGVITYNRSTIEPIAAVNWHSIACCFTSD